MPSADRRQQQSLQDSQRREGGRGLPDVMPRVARAWPGSPRLPPRIDARGGAVSTRARKKRERERRRADLQGRYGQRCDRALAGLGLLDGFRRLPRAVREHCYAWRHWVLEARADAATEALESAAAALAALERWLREPQLDLGGGSLISLRDLITALYSTGNFLFVLGQASPSPQVRAYAADAAAVIMRAFSGLRPEAMDLLGTILDGAAATFS